MSHHALLYRAPAVSKETALPHIPLLEASSIEFLEVDAFGIDDVRNLTQMSYQTPNEGSRLGIVVIVRTMSIESEQALLKLLEEPPKTTSFLFCIPEDVFLLPTILSRFNEINAKEAREVTDAFRDFAGSKLVERLAIVSSKLTDKDLLWQQGIKRGLFWYLETKRRDLGAKDLEVILYIATHLMTRGASNKQLLEELAFTLPFLDSNKNVTL